MSVVTLRESTAVGSNQALMSTKKPVLIAVEVVRIIGETQAEVRIAGTLIHLLLGDDRLLVGPEGFQVAGFVKRQVQDYVSEPDDIGRVSIEGQSYQVPASAFIG